jgi:iron complex outermembrane receptor protein
MKRTIMLGCLSCIAYATLAQQPNETKDSAKTLTPVEVKAIRAGDKAPFTKTNLQKKNIEKLNTGQDIPFLLDQTPSVVIHSDAGNGVGYTGIRIRGTDATRINVTLNGIPYNDAESQGTFFVDLPDMASSINSIQIQRGVGTSSNGTGAFGATISLSTNELNKKQYAELNNSFGSFNTWKNTVKAGTGLLNEHFTIDARLSRVVSDGYVDRAKSNLESFYLSGAYIGNRSSLRFNVFSGKEKTYQSWNGVPEYLLKTDRTYNSAGTDKPGEPYNNEMDNYTQTHYQLFFDTKWNDAWSFNTAAFLTRGLGYYENYKGSQSFSKYGMPDLVIGGTTIKKTDLIRQKWLDNYFYGQILSLQYRKNRNDLTAGGGWTVYDAKHYGRIIWAQYGFDKDHRYYNNDAIKSDINAFVKWQYEFSKYWNLFADLQYRHVRHKMNGFADNSSLFVDRNFDFVNPKAGISYSKKGWQAYFSYALAGKEPNRNDFEASLTAQPKAEILHDFETGIEKRSTKFQAGATLYYMLYKNQLVLTGMINDVGAYTRTNVPNSYRAGIELEGGYVFAKWLNASANITFSRNKIKSFTEFLDEYDANWEWTGQQDIIHENTTIALSPSTTGSAVINFLPAKNIELSLLNKYVSKQYLDNTENENRKLNAYYTLGARAIYTINNKLFKEWKISAQVNNVLDKKFEPNGYTYAYIYDGTITGDNYYYPMAGINFMLGLNIRL